MRTNASSKEYFFWSMKSTLGRFWRDPRQNICLLINFGLALTLELICVCIRQSLPYIEEAKKSLNGNNDNEVNGEVPEDKFLSPTALCKAEFDTRKYVDYYKGKDTEKHIYNYVLYMM